MLAHPLELCRVDLPMAHGQRDRHNGRIEKEVAALHFIDAVLKRDESADAGTEASLSYIVP